ncbi:MAG: P-loop NTPase [Clostridia bacterium]|nr:P-loop NTPase [Clostridia bacterium]
MSTKTQVILFTSCKGGVGKSTVCANLAMTMANMGKKILLIDCDFGNRCLDLVTGLSDEAVYDIGDVLKREIEPERAIIVDSRNNNISFIAAPYDFDFQVSLNQFKNTIKWYVDSGKYDYVFLDTPGGVGDPLLFASIVADIAFIIVMPTKAAVRAADRTASYLYGKGVTKQRLIVNQLCGKNINAAKKQILDIIDGSRVNLIGAIPYDYEVISAGNTGALVDEFNNKFVEQAFTTVVRRSMGEAIPLFYNIKKINKSR